MPTHKNSPPPRRHIDPHNIPEPFHALIPYAEKWAISDYVMLRQAVDAASIAELKDLVKTVLEFDAKGFDEWLRDRGVTNRTKDWIAFVLLVDACDVAKVKLEIEADDESTN